MDTILDVLWDLVDVVVDFFVNRLFSSPEKEQKIDDTHE